MLHYAIKYGEELRALRTVCIESVKPCGPHCNMDLTHYIWSSFEYYCANYALLVLSTRSSENKIVYVRHYEAEMAVRLLGFVDSAYALLRTLARIMILAAKNLKIVRAQFVINSPLL